MTLAAQQFMFFTGQAAAQQTQQASHYFALLSADGMVVRLRSSHGVLPKLRSAEGNRTRLRTKEDE